MVKSIVFGGLVKSNLPLNHRVRERDEFTNLWLNIFQHSRVESKESVSRTVAASDEDISGLGNSADDEASSWQSRLSVKTNDSQDPGEEEQQKDLDGDASSCVLQFKSVWFNFAAPPPSPKKRKLEFTR